MSQRALVEVVRSHASHCGYCQWADSSSGTDQPPSPSNSMQYKFGMVAHAGLSADTYGRLLDRNWRRSGTFLYRPSNERCCCPQYAIRLRVEQLQCRSQHDKVLRRFRHRLQPRQWATSTTTLQLKQRRCAAVKRSVDPAAVTACRQWLSREAAGRFPMLTVGARDANCLPFLVPLQPHRQHPDTVLVSTVAAAVAGRLRALQGSSAATSSSLSALSVARQLVPDHVPEELVAMCSRITSDDKALIMFHLLASPNHAAGGMGVEDVEMASHRGSNQVLPDPQTTTTSTTITSTPATLYLVTRPASFVEDEFALFSKYQKNVHLVSDEGVTRSGYDEFLCQSCLQPQPQSAFETEVLPDPQRATAFTFHSTGDVHLDYGTYHVRYELRSNSPLRSHLLAVSVIDILPNGLSSVYFLYDTDDASLSPGVLGTLLECQWQLHIKLQFQLDHLDFYYLGYYIQRCRKMRYKGQFIPSELLCPITLRWTPLDDSCRAHLDLKPFCKLYDGGESPLGNEIGLDRQCLERSTDQLIHSAWVALLTQDGQLHLIPAALYFRMTPDRDWVNAMVELFQRTGLALADRFAMIVAQ